MTSPEKTDETFEAHRPRLVRLAYRMLGSMAEAEDVVQDAWFRWRRVEPGEVRDASAYLRRTVTRLCLDVMKSARVRREAYVGSWLPEPIVEDDTNDDLREDELTLTLMLALERLSPLERAAFLLHDIFGVPVGEVATTLDREPAAVRQLATRARRHVRDAGPRYPVERREGERIARAFFAATKSGDLGALRGLLADDVVLRSDGGGRVIAFLNPIQGLDRALRLMAGLHRKSVGRAPELIRIAQIDGLPGFVSRDPNGILQTTALSIENGRITAVYITRNPDKLAGVARLFEAEGDGAPLN